MMHLEMYEIGPEFSSKGEIIVMIWKIPVHFTSFFIDYIVQIQ